MSRAKFYTKISFPISVQTSPPPPYHIYLRLPSKDHAIKGLVVCKTLDFSLTEPTKMFWLYFVIKHP